MATLEDLLEETGKFSRFQVLILALTLSPKILAGWSMLMMSFAGVVPDWWCVASDVNTQDGGDIGRNNATFQVCAQNETSQCNREYSHNIRTVINEWDLVCENAWIKPTVTSIQMAGVLVGALLGGQSADVIGRRYTLYISVLIHGVANVVAAYSVSWQMFTALRFVLGFMIGSLLVVTYTYPMEFIGVKERSICSSIPYWPIGVSLFALTAWRLPDWSQLHLVCGVLHVIFLIGFFFAPESVRWLALQGRIDESEKVINKMCAINGTKRPDRCREKLKSLALQEKELRETRGKYTYIEIIRGWAMFKRTLMIDLAWCFMSVIYYGLSFGVDKLSGNIYLNIFLMTFVELPGITCVMFITNRLGRRKSSAGLFMLGLLGAIGVIVTHYAIDVENEGLIITIFALIVKFGCGVGWCAFQVMSSESYPTVIRNLGYGAANTAARVGGIISPFLFTASNDVGIPFIVIASLFVIIITFALLLDETNGSPLQDTLMVMELQEVKSPGESRQSEQTKNSNSKQQDSNITECPHLAVKNGGLKNHENFEISSRNLPEVADIELRDVGKRDGFKISNNVPESLEMKEMKKEPRSEDYESSSHNEFVDENSVKFENEKIAKSTLVSEHLENNVESSKGTSSLYTSIGESPDEHIGEPNDLNEDRFSTRL